MQGLDRIGKLQMEETISRFRQTRYVKGYFSRIGLRGGLYIHIRTGTVMIFPASTLLCGALF